MTKIIETVLILSISIHLQVVLLSGETQPNSSTDGIQIKKETFHENPTKKYTLKNVQKELKISDEDIPSIPNSLSSKENRMSSDPNPLEQCMEPSEPVSRQARSVTKPAPKSQFEQLCGAFGRQPCTCYYPDHPDVTIFELSSDEITLSKMNGTGPSNCSDIQAFGNSLKGFYMVRLNNKRTQSIYCDFNQTNVKTNTGKTKMLSNNQSNSSVRPEFSEFCKGLQSQPCKVLYSDYPDIQPFDFNRNPSSKNVSLKNNIRRPTNCEDLYAIGYYLKGFYGVSLNANKVKLIYCDFNEIEKNSETKSLASQNSTSTTKNTSSTKISPYCNSVGSQPCSCFCSNFTNLLQFELSNDEITRQATSANGTGPESCEELKNIGYTFDGFYMIRFKTNIVKTIYCIFYYPEKGEYNQESTTQSTLKPSSTSLKTNESPETIECDKMSHLRNLNNKGKCLDGTPEMTRRCGSSNPSFYDMDFKNMCLYLVDCDNSSLSQQWVFRLNSYICQLSEDRCLAVEVLSGRKMSSREEQYRITVTSFYEAIAYDHQWAIDKRNRIVHSKSGMCLNLDSSTTWFPKKETRSWVKVQTCSKRKGEDEKWSFESILNGGVYKCANYSSLSTNLNDEPTVDPDVASGDYWNRLIANFGNFNFNTTLI